MGGRSWLRAAVIVVLMGPAGAGKTTIGQLLATQLSWEFADADDFHPAANIEKMSRGVGLNDEDRLPWLKFVHDAILRWQSQWQNVVLACSVLKRSYREMLGIHCNPNVKLVYLKASQDLLRARLSSRKSHYASEQLLASQLTDLEEPGSAEATTIDAARSPKAIVAEILTRLGLPSSGKKEKA